MRRFTVLLLLPVLAACVTEPPPLPPQDSCGAAALQGLVGQPATALQVMRFAHTVRVIEPGMMVTQDYVADRLNIHIDKQGLISRVVCG
ncbi:I78 family peptidase inhibitor [Fuscibacter oryzae]|uniref:Peptidase inhibitor I78 family protein n=1 Tax=Fuscibacter oryzae TaxID=2803939 RepID=A0A8J7MRV1_9RHOB|nr:I78 family peptidase inhibitor [Fuscibacter oryzae]MBL4929148.1 hypothetical protein [Fuscibacter oryzae]